MITRSIIRLCPLLIWTSCQILYVPVIRAQSWQEFQEILNSIEDRKLTDFLEEYVDGDSLPILSSWIYEAASAGHPKAQATLAYMYYWGIDVVEDNSKAEYWARKGLDKGNRDARWVLAMLYLDTELDDYRAGVREKGLSYFKDLAETGFPDLALELAEAYYIGDEDFAVQEDPVQALYWFKKAASFGDVEAMRLLGDYYYFGKKKLCIEADELEGAEWYRKAAEKGDPDAIQTLTEIIHSDAKFGTPVWKEDYKAWREHYLNFWKPVLEESTFEAYREYLEQHMDEYADYTSIAEFAVDYWNTRNSDSLSDFERFFVKYEDTRWEGTVGYHELGDMYDYYLSQEEQTITAFESYYRDYPEGQFVEEVVHKLVDLYYVKAEGLYKSDNFTDAIKVIETYTDKPYATSDGITRLGELKIEIEQAELATKNKQAAEEAEAARVEKERVFTESIERANKRINWGFGQLLVAGVSGVAGYYGVMLAVNADKDWHLPVGASIASFGVVFSIGFTYAAIHNFHLARIIRRQAERDFYAGSDIRIFPVIYPGERVAGLGLTIRFSDSDKQH